MQPDWTVSGKEAVLRAQDAVELNDEYKVYIIDYLMPDMNGIETVRRIRKVIREDVPIIVLTANAFDEDRRKAFECGMNGHIVKPIDMETIAQILAPIFKEEK